MSVFALCEWCALLRCSPRHWQIMIATSTKAFPAVSFLAQATTSRRAVLACLLLVDHAVSSLQAAGWACEGLVALLLYLHFPLAAAG
mgnify:CR=1 FL=1